VLSLFQVIDLLVSKIMLFICARFI